MSTFLWGNRPPPPQWAKASSLSRTHDHTQLDSSGRVISPTQKPLPDNTQHSQQTAIHTPDGIRIHNTSKQASGRRPTPQTAQTLRSTCRRLPAACLNTFVALQTTLQLHRQITRTLTSAKYDFLKSNQGRFHSRMHDGITRQ
jgi:hypothetical protein